MSFAFGIQSISPTGNNESHILGFATARSVADDTLLQLWNGATSAALAWKVDFEGRTLGGNGTAAKPAISFTSDPDSGLYRIGANNLGVAVNGAKVLDVTTAGLAITGTLSASGAITASAGVVGNLTGNVTGNVTGNLTGAVTGNASTATALQTARTINGTSFDGTGNITVTAAAGTLTGATLNATVTASSLTSLGTQAANLLFTDNTYDIGASGATRPRDIHLSRNAVVGGTINGQTISSTASFSGTLGVTGKVTLTDELEIDGALNHDGTTVGFYGVAPTTKLTVTGAHGSNAALQSLVSVLVTLGLVTDGTS